jgi:hypothetical protein
VLLSTLDDTVWDREAAEKEIRDEIKALERQLKDLRRGPGMTASNSRPHIAPQYASASKSTPRKEPAGDSTTEFGHMEPSIGRSPPPRHDALGAKIYTAILFFLSASHSPLAESSC